MKKTQLFLALLICCFFSSFYASGQCGSLTTIAGTSGTGGYSGDGSAATATRFAGMWGACKDRYGNTYIGDGAYIRKIDITTGLVSTIAGNGTSGFSGDGGAALSASIGGSSGFGQNPLCIDRNGDLIIADWANKCVRKVDMGTGMINTIVGLGGGYVYGSTGATTWWLDGPTSVCVDTSGYLYVADVMQTQVFVVDPTYNWVISSIGLSYDVTHGHSGDGGAASSATLLFPLSVAADKLGNIYIQEIGDMLSISPNSIYKTGYIRKIDPSGTITTIAGNGAAQINSPNQRNNDGDGGPATAAELLTFTGIVSDSIGNIYFLQDYNGSIRKVDAATGSIHAVAGACCGHGNNLLPFVVNAAGNILTFNSANIIMIDSGYSEVVTAIRSDSLISTACALPSINKFGLTVTIAGTPASTDSARIHIDYGDGDTAFYSAPYYSTGGGYTFGTGYNWLPPHSYIFPGVYRAQFQYKVRNGFSDFALAPPVIVGSVCDTNISSILVSHVYDSIVSTPCTYPANVRVTVKGGVAGNPSIYDSVYVKLYYGDGTSDFHVVTIDPSDTFRDASYYPPILYYGYTYVGYHNYASPGNYRPLADAVCNSGTRNYIWQDHGFGPYPEFTLANCSATGYITSSILTHDSITTGCAIPFTTSFDLKGVLHGAADTTSSIAYYINFGDGTDDTVYASRYTDGYGTYSCRTTVSHAYYAHGAFHTSIRKLDSTHVIGGPTISVGTSCSGLSGVLYRDVNGNCAADSGETRLKFWPIAVINNTLSDTSYVWCDSFGHYSIHLIDSNSYSIMPDYFGAFGYGVDSLSLSCPSSGAYSVMSTMGSSYSQNFGFACHGALTALDMHVAAWGYRFIPGDTGSITIWSSNSWGYMCDSLSATVSLTIDTNLTYLGMISGPTPTSISGHTLSWIFSTHDDLMDFNGEVKVAVNTTAVIGDTVHNRVHVTSTSLTDPDTSNNTYVWQYRIRSSWDPNEKEVSPQGFGAQGYIKDGTSLSYRVHFQNTGTARARNIVITDTLSNELDIATLQLIGSSASVNVVQVAGNIIEFVFNDIYLPDSATDLAHSNGYVSFNIDLKPNRAAGTQIANTANVYFDYNPAIVTNTTINTIEDTLHAIAGPASVCEGGTITLTNAIAGGVWTSSNGHASIAAGVVTGISAGIDTISYTVYGDQTVTKIITINPLPATGTITGTTSVCVGATTTLADATTGGTWSSASTSTASVSTTGVVSGIVAGSAVISYSLTNSCGTAAATATVTVNPLPSAGAIGGATAVCVGATTALSAATGGTWTSASTSIASISTSGVVTGVTAGSATISYTLTNGCGTDVATVSFTVNPLPVAGTITGVTTVCAGATTTLADATSGGTWTSGTTTIASISATGVVTGVAAGSATISYSVTNGCGTDVATASVTVNPLPVAGAITGTSLVCVGATTILSATAGGTWSSSSTSTASVSSAGVVTGVATGTATISYTVTNGCGTDRATTTITVNPLPSAGTITGTATVCVAATTALSATGGGTWTSSSTSTASVSATGVVTGVAAGTVTISYSVTNSCGTDVATATVTVNPLPSAGTITGTTTVCVAATTTLSAATGGTWTSGSTSTASVSTTGVVTGVAAGSVTISYSVTNSCGTDVATASVTVNPLPVAGTITGSDSVCVASSVTLGASGSSGTTSTWTLSNTSATISGTAVTGAYAGTDTAIHTSSNSCGTVSATKVIAVMPLPDPGTLTGADSVCAGATITLTETVTGGTWSISGTSATVASGVVTGVSTGTSVVTYSVSNYCGTGIRVHPVVTNPLPVAGTLSGTAVVCEGATTTIASSVGGGTWSSSVTTIATVGAAGVVTGIAAGITTISYTYTNSCGSDVATISVTVNPLPVAGSILGPDSVCVGDTIVLTHGATTGAWASADATIASVSSAGDVIGISSGSVVISYTVTNSCGSASASHNVYVKSIADCNTGVSSHQVAVGSPTVFPNPNNGSFVVEIPAGVTNATIVVTDLTGKVITAIQPKNAAGLKVPVDLGNVAAGAYLLTINIDGKLYHDKVVVY